MIYHCDNCNYTFEDDCASTPDRCPERCPDCGHPNTVRLATEDEITEYKQIRLEIEAELSHAAS